MADLSIAEVLNRAADLIEPEGKWTQGASYRNAHGAERDGDEPDVACRCIVGAINAVCEFQYDRAQPAWGFLETRVIHTLADKWNDAPERTQAEVVAKLREAAALASRNPEIGEG